MNTCIKKNPNKIIYGFNKRVLGINIYFRKRGDTILTNSTNIWIIFENKLVWEWWYICAQLNG